jgi:hypothetical protein
MDKMECVDDGWCRGKGRGRIVLKGVCVLCLSYFASRAVAFT